MTNSILVYIELFNNEPLNVSKEIISKLQNSSNNILVNGVVITDFPTFNAAKNS